MLVKRWVSVVDGGPTLNQRNLDILCLSGSTIHVGLMLGHRLRCWPNIKPALGQRLGFHVEQLVGMSTSSKKKNL